MRTVETTGTVHVSLPRPLISQLRRRAEVEDRPVCRVVRRALKAYFASSAQSGEEPE